jgi:D-glycero-D-manno-heptose 1,7-bisphosphate phosphatase
MDPVVFLDRDNTLIANDGDLGDPARVVLLDGVPDGLRRLRDAGYRLVVVTNQGGVARGRYGEDDVDRVHREIAGLVDHAAGRRGLIDRFYYCPFHPEATIEAYRREHPWRKPQPGMLLQAARDLGLDLNGSWLIGDQARDIEAGNAAGCRTVRLGSLADSSTFAVAPTASAAEFGEAVDLILASGKPSRGRGEEMTEFSQLRRAIDDLAESTRPRGTGSARAIGASLLMLAPLPFVAGLLFLEEPQSFLAWMLVTVVILLASIASFLLERR